MARTSNESMMVMVPAAELQALLKALDKMANGQDEDVQVMTSPKDYRNPANPLRRLILQYNASIELYATPCDGDA